VFFPAKCSVSHYSPGFSFLSLIKLQRVYKSYFVLACTFAYFYMNVELGSGRTKIVYRNQAGA
jgi:hypothetical protein